MVNVSTGSDNWLASNSFELIRQQDNPAPRLADSARQLVASLPAALQDDRYLDALLPADSLGAAVVSNTDGQRPVAFMGGSLEDDVLHLDALADESGAWPAETVLKAVQLLIDESTASAQQRANAADAPTLQLWTRPDERIAATAIAAMGFGRVRSLYQLRVALPLSTEAVPTRSFDPDRDLTGLVAVNNRSFADHPDQSNQTETSFTDLMNESWFDPDGLRILDDPDGSGTMAGFCWTKVHPAGNYHEAFNNNGTKANPLGEIYIIGLDPDFHGRGLGVPLVAAGLDWLTEAGTNEVLLYVESDNQPALRTYERLGFTINRTDTAWRRTTASTSRSSDTGLDHAGR